jgi:hypothetical protein
MSATGPLQSLLERDTLARWAEQLPAIDVGELYDQLRSGLTDAQAAYQDARFRHDHRAASAAAGEITDLTGLLAVITEALEWRRGWYLTWRRPWPLHPVMI